MGDTAVDIAGFGLPGKKITLAEMLSKSGNNTVHIGKWHRPDAGAMVTGVTLSYNYLSH